MAIGVNWKDVWKSVWKNVWDQGSGSTYETSLEHGTYTFTGQDALIDYALNLEHGVYTIMGRPINTVYSGAPVVSTGTKVVGLKMSIGM